MLPAALIEETKRLYAELTFQLEEIAVLQRNLQGFLAEYHREIGPLCEALSALQPQEVQGEAPVGKENPASDAKKLYHRLMKRHHPDTASIPLADNQFFAMATQAYQQQDVAMLTVLEQIHYTDDMNNDELLALSERYDGLVRALYAAEQKKEIVKNDPAYQLRQDVLEAKLQGRDMIAEIKEELHQRIHAARQSRQLA